MTSNFPNFHTTPNAFLYAQVWFQNELQFWTFFWNVKLQIPKCLMKWTIFLNCKWTIFLHCVPILKFIKMYLNYIFQLNFFFFFVNNKVTDWDLVTIANTSHIPSSEFLYIWNIWVLLSVVKVTQGN